MPLIVGAPQLKRYTAFGHLFAAYQGQVYRIDRHPVMCRHPVTPMDEADLAVHLAKQTTLPVALADLASIAASDADQRMDKITAAISGIMLIDVGQRAVAGDPPAGKLWRAKRLAAELVYRRSSSGARVRAASSVEAQAASVSSRNFSTPEKSSGLPSSLEASSDDGTPDPRCGPRTGFDGMASIPSSWWARTHDPVDRCGAVEEGVTRLKAGRGVVLHTALGPEADRGSEIDRLPGARHRLRIGPWDHSQAPRGEGTLNRAVVAGGATSSHALKELRIDALTTLLPLLPRNTRLTPLLASW